MPALNIYIRQNDKEELMKLAEVTRQTISSFVRQLIIEKINASKSKK